MSLYACIYAREFPAQALLRLRPELGQKPCVVFEGEPPLQSVCARNALAGRMGVVHGMTRVEVDTFPGITALGRSHAQEAAARAALFDCAAAFSPAAEECSSSTEFIAVVDITGTERLHGPPEALGHALQNCIRAAGISAMIAIAQNFHAAICLARGRGTARHPLTIPPGDEDDKTVAAAALAPLPVTVLDLIPEQAETFAAWGIDTLGALAALPEAALIARLGQPGRRLRQLAHGTHPHHFTPMDRAPIYTETIEFDAPVEQLESLLFVVGAMLDQLMLRVSSRALALAAMAVTLTLEPSGTHTRTVRPALPTNDKHTWLKLIHLDLEAHPPQAPVLTLTLSAEPGRTSKVQQGLFSPQLPDAVRLDVALARVRALVGEDSAGAPVLSDTHRPDAFKVDPFSVTNAGRKSALPVIALGCSTLTQRQVRPSEELFVTTCDHRPATFYFRQKKYGVTQAYGPWLCDGDWWNRTLWGAQQWDIIARSAGGDLLCCCLHCDLIDNRWHMVALYD